jgi:N-formylglutamate amidohydrolase
MTVPPFDLFNAHGCRSPVVIAVPHAGRDYPVMDGALLHPVARLLACEDRFADRLARGLIAAGVPVIIARTPRLWIDLNRSERDLDPAMMAGGVVTASPLSSKVRGGLGLIPRRLAGIGELWRLPLASDDVRARIEQHHRPYHAALSAQLDRLRGIFGGALLIDLHSMPPLAPPAAARIVIGDRFGASASAALSDSAHACLTGLGYIVAMNAPYAGGYSLERHTGRARGIHALQIEIDRTLYLDESSDIIEAAAGRVSGELARLAARLGDECARLSTPVIA